MFINKITSEPLNGSYYLFDCLGVIYNSNITGLSDNMIESNKYINDKEAIKEASNYEASLIKYTYKNGERVEALTLYEPNF